MFVSRPLVRSAVEKLRFPALSFFWFVVVPLGMFFLGNHLTPDVALFVRSLF